MHVLLEINSCLIARCSTELSYSKQVVISAWLDGYGIFGVRVLSEHVFQEVNYMYKNELMITTTTHSLVVVWISRELQQLTALDEPIQTHRSRVTSHLDIITPATRL